MLHIAELLSQSVAMRASTCLLATAGWNSLVFLNSFLTNLRTLAIYCPRTYIGLGGAFYVATMFVSLKR